MKTKTKKKAKKKSTALAVAKPSQVEIQKVQPGAPLSQIESVLVGGDLAVLSPDNRFNYYLDVCKSLQLNPLTQPFGYISLDGRMTLYARKDCAEQLRKIHGVSVTSIKREYDEPNKILTVDVTVKDKYGKVDAASGSLYMMGWDKYKKVEYPLKGQELANAKMKCETKAKRRATLSICGLSMPDESEIVDIKDAKVLTDEEVQKGTGVKVVKPEPKPAQVVTEKPVDQIIGALPQALKDKLKAAGYDSLSKAHGAYKEVAGDLDALEQLCNEKIKMARA